jgi:shikimate kinase
LRGPVPEATLSARIALIGLSGAGKSAAAPLLAAALGFAVLDLDLEVQRATGTAVSELIRTRGEAAFRELEARSLEAALRGEPRGGGLVIACGGGVLGLEENRERLRRGACVIWLQVAPETAAERLGSLGRDARPLLDGGTALERLQDLEAARREAYRAAADAVVDTEGRSPAEVAEAVATAWRERSAWDSSAS